MQGPGFYHSHIVYRSRSTGFASVTLNGRMERMGKWDVNWNWIPRYFAQSCWSLLPDSRFATRFSLCFQILSLLHWALASEPSKFCGKKKLTISWKILIKLIGLNSCFFMWYQSKDIPPFTGTSSFLPPFRPSFLPRKVLTPHKFTPEFWVQLKKESVFPVTLTWDFWWKAAKRNS